MSSRFEIKACVVGLLLAGIGAGPVGAQIVQRASYMSGGLFTVSAREAVSFHVSLDDHNREPNATVLMNLYDHEGTLKKSRLVTLAPGQSATLTHRLPGRYRAQVVIIDPPLQPSGRRSVVGCAEIGPIDDLTTVNKITCLPYPPKDDQG